MPAADDQREQEGRWEAHLRMHEQEQIALDLVLKHEAEREQDHRSAHDVAHVTHAEKHDVETDAVRVALEAVERERKIHSEAHTREHLGHSREHELNNLAIDKAEAATDKRFAGVNGTREQMSELIRTMASKESVELLSGDLVRRWEEARHDRDRRFEETHKAITDLEKGDVKQEGHGIGQAAGIAVIVTAISIMGGLLGIIVILSQAMKT